MSEPIPIIDYVVYQVGTGRIVTSGRATIDGARLQARPGCDVLLNAVASDVRHYVDPASGEIVERAALGMLPSPNTIAADGVDFAIVAGIPVGALCWIRGPVDVAPWVESSGQVRITTNVAGTYVLTVDHPRYAVATLTIEATP